MSRLLVFARFCYLGILFAVGILMNNRRGNENYLRTLIAERAQKRKRHGACRRYDLRVEFNHARRQATSNPSVSFDERAVKDELLELVSKTIEETIYAMLDEEADQLVGPRPTSAVSLRCWVGSRARCPN